MLEIVNSIGSDVNFSVKALQANVLPAGTTNVYADTNISSNAMPDLIGIHTESGTFQINVAFNTTLDKSLIRLLLDVRNAISIFVENNLKEPGEMGFHAKQSEQINTRVLKDNLAQAGMALEILLNDNQRQDALTVNLKSCALNIQNIVDNFRLDLVRLHTADLLPASKTGRVLDMVLGYKQAFGGVLQELSAFLVQVKDRRLYRLMKKSFDTTFN